MSISPHSPGSRGGEPLPTFKLTVSLPVKARTTIPVARVEADGSPQLLIDPAGNPVWPIESDEDLEAIKQTLAVFNADFVETRAGPANVPSGDGSSEVVLGVGEAGPTAELYGHLTGRKVDYVEGIDELSPSDEMPAVIVHCSPRLDRDLMQLLALAQYDFQATGVIWGRTQPELRLQALTAACAATVNGPLTTGHLHLVGPGLGGKAPNRPVSEIREILAKGSGVVSIVAHNDGTSQVIDSTAALCPRARPSDADPARGPECLTSGTCYLLGTSVATAFAEDRMIAPEEISARIFVNLGCHSAFMGNAAVESKWSTLPNAVANSRIGAVLATPTIGNHMPGPTDQEFLQSLREGEPVGRAIVLFEENPTMQQLGSRIMLFGDPRVRGNPGMGNVIKRDTVTKLAPKARDAIRIQALPAEQELARLEMARLVGRYIRHETREKGEHTSQSVRERIAEVEEAEGGEDTAGTLEASRLRAATLDHLATTKARLWEAWQWAGYRCELERTAQACPNCGWRTRSRVVELPSGSMRDNFMCAICSDVWDFDFESEIRPFVSFPEVQLRNADRASHWDGAVFVVRRSASDTIALEWPRQPDGSPAPTFTLDHKLAEGGGLVRIYATFFDGLALHSYCQPIGPSRPVAPPIAETAEAGNQKV